jgi:midasin
MKSGGLLLLDEVSLPDDSVLERINSVLEPARTLVLAEKGDDGLGAKDETCHITAHSSFRVVATMNPGGDFGKKELSPALRNRFTEVWVAAVSDRQDLFQILCERMKVPIDNHEKETLCNQILDFIEWLISERNVIRVVSVRDLLAWVDFMNQSSIEIGVQEALFHGAFLVFLDG